MNIIGCSWGLPCCTVACRYIEKLSLRLLHLLLRLEVHAKTCPPLCSESGFFVLADNQTFCAGRNMGCSSVVTAPDEVSIEVDEDVVMPAELTITRNTRTTETNCQLTCNKTISSICIPLLCHVCMYISVIMHHAC